MLGILLLFLPLVLIFGLAIFLSWLPMPGSIQPYQNMISAIFTGLLGFIYAIGIVVYFTRKYLKGSKRRDQIFTQLGFKAGPYALFGRRYQGRFRGRKLDVYYLPGFRFYSPTLDIYLQTSVQTRFAIINNAPRLSCRSCPQIQIEDLESTNLQVFALDADWIRAFLAESQARGAVLRLTTSDGAQVYLQPGTLWWRDHRWGFHPVEVETWIEDLTIVAETMERSPSPEVVDEPYTLEKKIHVSRNLTTVIIVILLALAVLPLVLLCSGLTLFLLLRI